MSNSKISNSLQKHIFEQFYIKKSKHIVEKNVKL